MSFHIHVPDTSIQPGSYIGGSVRVSFEPEIEIYVEKFTVTLSGIFKSRTTTGEEANDEVHESNTTFLEIVSNFHGYPSVLEPGRNSMFHFQLPWDPESTQADIHPGQLDRTPKSQVLPPSCDLGYGNKISYSFDFSLIGEDSRKSLSASTPLSFSKTRSIQTPDPRITTVLPEIKLGERTHVPIVLNISQVIVQEQAFHLVLRRQEGSDIAPPASATMEIKSCRVLLIATTSIQSTQSHNKQWSEKYTIASYDLYGPRGCRHMQPIAPEISTQDFDLGMLLRNPSISVLHPPTFKHTNVERTYGLQILVTASCGENSFESNFRVDPVTILAAESACALQSKQWEASEAEEAIGHERGFLRGTSNII